MDDPANPDVVLHRLFNTQLARPSEQAALLTELIDTYPGADGRLPNAELTLQRAHFDLGDKPLSVLSGTHEQDALPVAQLAKVTRATLENQADLAAHSTPEKQLLVDSKTKYIQTLHPDVVVRAVTEVIEKVRKQAASRGTGPAPSLIQRGDFLARIATAAHCRHTIASIGPDSSGGSSGRLSPGNPAVHRILSRACLSGAPLSQRSCGPHWR